MADPPGQPLPVSAGWSVRTTGSKPHGLVVKPLTRTWSSLTWGKASAKPERAAVPGRRHSRWRGAGKIMRIALRIVIDPDYEAALAPLSARHVLQVKAAVLDGCSGQHAPQLVA